ncbi:hypothetical protein EV702DRAFT_1044515 [Suillus placidus]|uniref:Ribonuclease H1 N-terminal domain-containing protein n=1 Tax=Suillus placidus TaxID=48579 RepID=A0A9P6ZXL6_9AGAM|nr:hypothetical protein EV702DRAFT_1044515 [Suillus placidus]
MLSPTTYYNPMTNQIIDYAHSGFRVSGEIILEELPGDQLHSSDMLIPSSPPLIKGRCPLKMESRHLRLKDDFQRYPHPSHTMTRQLSYGSSPTSTSSLTLSTPSADLLLPSTATSSTLVLSPVSEMPQTARSNRQEPHALNFLDSTSITSPESLDTQKFYSVRVGRKIGVFSPWWETWKHVHCYPSAEYKSFHILTAK